MTRRILVAGVAAALLLSACTGPGGSASKEPTELTVFAAASLRDSMEAVADAYEAANPGTTLVVATDSSAALATQIQQGAPADVFLSADTKNPQALVDHGLADGAAVPFAGNSLVVVVHGDDNQITSPVQLAEPGVDIIAAGDDVPITTYATQVVQNLAAEPGYPVDFVEAYQRNIVSREDNAQAIIAKLALGEGAAAIVYATDAKASKTLVAIGIPPSANVTATYAGVVVKASGHPDRARAFLTWLAGPDGQEILADFGFAAPP